MSYSAPAAHAAMPRHTEQRHKVPSSKYLALYEIEQDVSTAFVA